MSSRYGAPPRVFADSTSPYVSFVLMQRWITGGGRFETDFSGVRTTGISPPLHLEVGHAYHAEQLGRTVWIQPVREQRSITLSFAVHSAEPPDHVHAPRCISHVLGHEGVSKDRCRALLSRHPHRRVPCLPGPGSLLSFLKRSGWATGLSAGASTYRHFAMFDVSVRLTPDGLLHLDDVVRACFQVRRECASDVCPDFETAVSPPSRPPISVLCLLQGVAALHAQDDVTWSRQHEEIAQLAANGVRFRAKSEPTSAVLSAVSAMRDYATEHALVGSALIGQFDLGAVHSLLRLLNPHQMLLTVTAKPPHAEWRPFPADGTIEQATEPHYGFNYATARFSAAQLAAWGARPDAEQGANGWRSYPVDLPLNAALAPPPLNEFIPTDFTLKSGDKYGVVSSSAGDPGAGPATPSDSPDVDLTAAARRALFLPPHALDFPFSRPGTDEVAPIQAPLQFSSFFPEPSGPVSGGRFESFRRTDDKFLLPKSTLFLRLALPRSWEFTSDPRRRMHVSVLLSVLDDLLQVRGRLQAGRILRRVAGIHLPLCAQESTYAADLAGLRYNVSKNASRSFLVVTVSGFSHKLPRLVGAGLQSALACFRDESLSYLCRLIPCSAIWRAWPTPLAARSSNPLSRAESMPFDDLCKDSRRHNPSPSLRTALTVFFLCRISATTRSWQHWSLSRLQDCATSAAEPWAQRALAPRMLSARLPFSTAT